MALAHCLIDGAQGALENHLIADDIPLGASIDGTQGNYHRLQGRDVAGNYGVHTLDHGGGSQDGVDAGLGIGAVSGLALDGDLDTIGGGVELVKLNLHIADVHVRHDMLADDIIHLGIFHASLLDHALGSSY